MAAVNAATKQLRVLNEDEAEELYDAVKAGEMDQVRKFVESGADLRFQWGDEKLTVLHAAVEGLWTEMARYLVANGADIDARNDDGDTAIEFVEMATDGESELDGLMVRALAELGASLETLEVDGGVVCAETLLGLAVESGASWPPSAFPSFTSEKYVPDPEKLEFVTLWTAGKHPVQLARVAVETSLLAARPDMPAAVAEMVGDYVHARTRVIKRARTADYTPPADDEEKDEPDAKRRREE